MEKRVLGRTGHKSTLISFGAAVFIYPTSEKEGDNFIKFALDRGVNHIDVAPTYGDAEQRLGKWIQEYRSNLFLACKTGKWMKEEAANELRESLRRLQTDYFDLYQLHGLDDYEELKIALGDNGAIEAIIEAKEQDLVKYVGITSHNPNNIMKALKIFDFDTVLLPVNYVLQAHPDPQNNYEPVIEYAKKKNIGVIAMKSAAKGPWPTKKRTHNTWYQPFNTRIGIDEALRFTLSQNVATATSSSDIKIAKMMIDAAESFTSLSDEKQKGLLLKAAKYKPLFP